MFLFIKHQGIIKAVCEIENCVLKITLLNSNIPKTFTSNKHTQNEKRKIEAWGTRKRKKNVKEKLNFFKMKLKKFRESSLYERKKKYFIIFSLLYSHHQPTKQQQHHREIPHSKSHIQIKIHSKQTNDERNQQQQQIIIYISYKFSSLPFLVFSFSFSFFYFHLFCFLDLTTTKCNKKKSLMLMK